MTVSLAVPLIAWLVGLPLAFVALVIAYPSHLRRRVAQLRRARQPGRSTSAR